VNPWLHVVGIGEDGLAGLAPALRALVEAAEVIVGGERHLAMAPAGAERMAWPSPWDAMVERIGRLRGRRVVVLVTGDPSWFSGGVTVARAFAGQAVVHPHPGAFSHAAARMLWRVEECEGLSVHGRGLGAGAAHLGAPARGGSCWPKDRGQRRRWRGC
jgi:precorrin-6Y C5,15-methyltransferase (decarboxylating)